MIVEQIANFKEKYNIKGMIGQGMRGRSIPDAIVIIDEVQNFSKLSLQKILTRFSKNCKVILIGSNKQIDNPYVTKYTNGLSVLLDACRYANNKVTLHAVTLTRVLRSRVTEFVENLFSSKP